MKLWNKNNKMKRIFSALLALLLCLPSVPAPAENNLPIEADGTKIEDVEIKWITPDSSQTQEKEPYSDDNEQFLFLAPSGDKKISMQYQVDISLSGQMDYQPGDIVVRIPAQVWHARKYVDDGNGGVQGVVDEDQLIGSMTLSIPEAPSTTGDFNWQLVDGEYIITNVSTIGAARKCMFQFSIDGLYPHEIVDGSTCIPFEAVCEVTTAKGTLLSRASQQLTAKVDTIEQIDEDAAKKSGAVYLTPSVSSIPINAWSAIGGFNRASDYVLVQWKLDLDQRGNQPYTLTLEDILSDVSSVDVHGTTESVETHPVLLYYSGKEDLKSAGSFEDEIVNSPVFVSDPESRTVELWLAYPKDELPAKYVDDTPIDYYFHNNSTWTLQEADADIEKDPEHGLNEDKRKVTTSSDGATLIYTPESFSKAGEITTVEKLTENGEKQETYENALTRLVKGEATDVEYLLKMENFSWDRTSPDMYNYTDDRPKTDAEMSGTEPDQDLYGTLGWRAITEDYRRVFNNSGVQMDPDDFEFSSVQLGDYSLWRYGPAPKGGIGVVRDSDGSMRQRIVAPNTLCYYEDLTLPKPDVLIEYKLNGTGDWIPAATAKWGTDGTGSLWFDDLAAGVDTNTTAKIVTFPANVSDVRYTVTNTVFDGQYADRSDVAAVVLTVYPTITVLPTEKNVDLVKQVMETVDSPSILLENDVRMYQEGWIDPADGIGHAYRLINSDHARAELSGLEYGVWLEKTADFDPDKDNDTDKRLVTVHYTGTLVEQSNISDLSAYQDAVADGSLPSENKGIYYDLLPEGFSPVMSTLRTDPNDRITGAYLIRAWKGSTRDLLVVETDMTPALQLLPPDASGNQSKDICDIHHIYFDAVTSHNDVVIYGQEPTNYLAFESLSGDLIDGILGTEATLQGASDKPDQSANKHTPDMPDQITDLLTGLDPASDPAEARFVYARDYTNLNIVISAISGLSKMVRDDLAGIWTEGLNGQTQATVYEGHDYTYSLEISSGAGTITRNMFLFDSIENYHVPKDGSKDADWQHTQDRKAWPGDWEGIGQWRGTLNAVDLSEFIGMGVAPVLYVSRTPDLVFADSTDGMTQDEKYILFRSGTYDVTDSTYWTKVDLDDNGVWTVPDDLKGQITAIAVDATKDSKGAAFELLPELVMTAYLHMTAPDDDGDETLRHAKGAYAQTDGVIDWVAATDPANNMYAFNNTRLRCVQTKEDTPGASSDETMIREDYTRVGILPEIINVEKFWEDDDNHDNTRPAEIVVNLFRKVAGSSADPEPVLDAQGKARSVTLTGDKDSKWKAQFLQVDVTDENGKPYLYSFTETLPDGTSLEDEYKLSWNKATEPNVQLTNSRENETVAIHGFKTWDDNDNAAGKRPASIFVELYCDGVRVDTLEITADRYGQWEYDFGSLERYKRYDPKVGQLEEHIYTVRELPLDYYRTSSPNYTSVVNKYEPYGDVEIIKKLDGITDKNKDRKFEFTVTFAEKAGDKYPISGSFNSHVEQLVNGNWVPVTGSDKTVSSGDKVYLTADQKIVIEDLPTTTVVTVTETEDPLYQLEDLFGNTAEQTANVPAGAVSTFSYTNVYNASASLQLKAGKQLTGQAMRKNEFSFTIREKDSGKNEIVSTGRVGTPENKQEALGKPIIGTASVTFSPIKYTAADAGKTFTYEMSEDIPADAASGMTYDPTSVTFTVRVEDNGDGTLKTTVCDAGNNVIPDGNEIHLFENEYKAECDVTLELKKVLEGRTLQDKEFEFELCTCDEKGENAVPLTPAVKNDGDSVVFSGYDALHFDQDDVSLDPDKQSSTYYFLVREKEGSDPEVDYTKENKLFTVKIYDQGDGALYYTLDKQKVISSSDPCIYCQGSSDHLWPYTVKADMSIFTLRTEIGQESYQFVTDEFKQGILDAGQVDFAKIPDTTIKRTGDYGYVDWDYWFELIWDDLICDTCKGFGAVGDISHLSGLTASDFNADMTIKANSYGITNCPDCHGSGISKDFAGLSGATDGYGYYFDIYPCSAVNGTGRYVGDGLAMFLHKTSMYYSGTVYDLVWVSLSGYRDAILNVETSFSSGFGKLWKAQTCPFCDGTGGTSGLEIVGDPGTPVLTNTLKPGTLRLTKKAASDAIPADETFDFVVTLIGDAIINTVSYTSSLDPAGTPAHTVDVVDHKFTVTLVKDETLSFQGIPNGTRYEIVESPKSAPSPLPGYVTVSKDHETGTVATNENCNATFVNGIGPCEFTLSKAAPGVTAKAAEKTFTFDVYLEDTSYRPLANQTVTVTPSFADVTFDADGYAIQPVPDAETLTLDKNGHTAVILAPGQSLTFIDLPEGTRVTVREQSETDLPGWTMPAGTDASSMDKLEWVYDSTNDTYTNVTTRIFTNVYEAKGILNLAARKVLDGRDPETGEFTFELYRSDENGQYIGLDSQGKPYPITGSDVSAALLATAVNTAAGDVAFEAIPLTEEGTLWYLIREQIPASADPTVAYSDETILVRVPVVDREGKGHLDIGETVSGEWKDGPFYTNSANMDAPDTITNRVIPATLCVEKKITGGTPSAMILANSQFAAELSFTDAEGDAWTGDANHQITATDGTVFTATDDHFVLFLTPGASLTFTDLPVDLDYAVVETGTMPGWTLDPQTYTGKTVSCATDEDIAWVTLTNEYAPKGTYSLKLRKTLSDENGQPLPLQAGMFSFVIRAASGKTLATAENEADGTVVFDPITFTLADVGTRILYVSELDLEKPGYETDPRIRTLTLSIKESPDSTEGLSVTGTLAFMDKTTVDADLFENVYKPLINVPVAKIWKDDGHTDLRDDVTLTLYAVDMDSVFTLAQPSTTWTGAPADLLSNPWTISRDVAIASDIQSGTWYGLPVADSLERPYTYVVQENGVPEDYISVVTGDQNNGVEVVNKLIYGEVPLAITKTVDGEEPWEDEIFSFTLADETGLPIETVTNTVDSATFTNLLFTKADVGTHVYTVTEDTPSKDYYDQDDSEYTVTVVVTTDGYAVTVVPTIEKDGEVVTGITFDNSYKPTGSIQPQAEKKLDGRVMTTEDRFSFTITENGKTVTTGNNNGTASVTFAEIVYTLEDVGTHTYVISEDDTTQGGITKDATTKTWTVHVTDNKDGTLTAVTVANETDTLTFTNLYEATGSIQPQAEKKLDGRVMTTDDRFSFTITENGTPVATGNNNGTASVTFTEIVYTQKDVGTHTYVISEDDTTLPGITKDATTKAWTVLVTDNKDGTLTAVTVAAETDTLIFTNLYEATGSIQPQADKKLDGRVMTTEDRFSFTITENGTPVATGNNNGTASVTFTEIVYTQEDVGTHTYVISEDDTTLLGITKDATTKTWTVHVTDNKDGTLTAVTVAAETDTLTFTNLYEATGSIQPQAEKKLDGRVMTTDDRFSFTITENGTPVATGNNNGTASVTFTEIVYTQEDVGTHTYVISEDDTTLPGITKDATTKTWTVHVTDNKDGTLTAVTVANETDTLTFTNLYEATGSMDLQAVKYMRAVGSIPGADEKFDFVLEMEDGTTTTVQNGENGIVDFGTVEYTLDDLGTHVYKIREKQLVNGNYITDPTVYEVTVEVADNGDGTLKLTTTVKRIDADGTVTDLNEDDKLIFVNDYKTSIAITKQWQGGEEDEIQLTLYAGDEVVPETETVTDPETGKPVEKINYILTRDGYRYTFSQLAPRNVDGSTAIYRVKEKGISGYMRIYQNVGDYKKQSDYVYDGGTIINRAVTSIRVKKVWDGISDATKRPEITLTLYRNGSVYNKKPSGPNKDGWYTWNNLPLQYEGRDAVYYVIEEPLPSFKTTYSNVGMQSDVTDRAYDGGTITNSGVPKTGDTANPVLWSILAVLGLTGCGFALFTLKKKKK